tara:strand:- start:219 stop:848 length:630 start_codon:yes stop_codon:yes gene_type:complete
MIFLNGDSNNAWKTEFDKNTISFMGKTEGFYSQIGQDEWVVTMSESKKNGYFLDIGAAHPTDISNSYYVEKELGWKGVCIDLGVSHYAFHSNNQINSDEQYMDMWKQKRSSPLYITDALQVDFDKLYEDNFPTKRLDYLSIDLSPPNVSLEFLLGFPIKKYSFDYITFETDWYSDKSTREPSRDFLLGHGYRLAVTGEQEDWYVNKDLS